MERHSAPYFTVATDYTADVYCNAACVGAAFCPLAPYSQRLIKAKLYIGSTF